MRELISPSPAQICLFQVGPLFILPIHHIYLYNISSDHEIRVIGDPRVPDQYPCVNPGVLISKKNCASQTN